MGDASMRSGEEVDLGAVELHAMGMPDIFAGPAEVFGVLPGAAPEFFQ